MAEAPDHGLHEPLALRTWRDATGEIRVFGPSFGPAGAIAVDLPDGSSWSVDHHDPDRLVSYEPPDAVDDGSSLSQDPVLVALVGGEVAMALGDALDVAFRAEETFDDPGPPPWPRRRGQMPSPMAELLLLVDLVDDAESPPLGRVAAGVEAIRRLQPTAGGDLLLPLRTWIIESVAEAAATVEQLEVAELDPRLVGDLSNLLVGLDEVADGLSELLRTIRGWLDEFDGRGSMVVQPFADSDLLGAAAEEPAGEPTASDADSMAHPEFGLDLRAVRDASPLRVERISPVLVEVSTTDPSESGRWVTVRRQDGFVHIGHAPLRETWNRSWDGVLSAVVAVPPDLSEDGTSVAIVDEEEVSVFGSAPFQSVRDAVRAGRAACREGRLGRLGAARAAWERCAVLWSEAHDDDRARMAADLAALGPAGPQARAFLADRISASLPASST